MKNEKDLVSVISSRARAFDFWAIGHYLPNPDPVLKKMGKDISAYRQILSDAFVGGCVRRRKAGISALNYRIEPSDNKKVDDFVINALSALPMKDLINQILEATLFGYQVFEIIWQAQGSLLAPLAVIGKNQEWFAFDDNNNLLFKSKDNHQGELVPNYKFLVVTQDATYSNPYGRADLSLCFWAATFKKGGFKFWLNFVEKYGTPFLVGRHPRNSSASEIEELLVSLEEMQGNAVAAIPTDSSIEILEAGSKSGSSTVFDEFMNHCKSEIAVAILGQNQTTEKEATRASALAGLEVTKEIRNQDALVVEKAINQLISWIVEINFGDAPKPTFALFEPEKGGYETAQRDAILTTMGVKFTKEYLQRIYNFKDGDFELLDNNKDTETDFSEEPVTETSWLDEALQELLDAKDYDELKQIIDEKITETDDKITKTAKKAAILDTNAFLKGRFEVTKEKEKL